MPAVSSRNDIKVLIIDDETDILLTLKAILELHRYDVSVFDKPIQALKHLKETAIHYDLIITDYRMPGSISGLDLAREIRDHGGIMNKSKKTKILLITAYETGSGSSNFLEAIKSGLIDGVIQKPVSNEKLITEIEKIILHSNNNNNH